MTQPNKGTITDPITGDTVINYDYTTSTATMQEGKETHIQGKEAIKATLLYVLSLTGIESIIIGGKKRNIIKMMDMQKLINEQGIYYFFM